MRQGLPFPEREDHDAGAEIEGYEDAEGVFDRDN